MVVKSSSVELLGERYNMSLTLQKFFDSEKIQYISRNQVSDYVIVHY